jgi:membrane protein
VLTGGILVHSLSAYESSEQAARSTVLKALDVLYLFWQRQQSGLALREVDMINDSHEVLVGLDSVTWGELRDLFLREKLIAQNDRGQYFLSRDLNSITFWQLKEWVSNELPLSQKDIEAHLPWQDKAYDLLRKQRQQQRELLDITLAELFEC